MLKAGKAEITRTDFLERYRKSHGEAEGLSELGCALAWAYFSRMNAFFPSEEMLDQFIAGSDKRFISLDAKFREVEAKQFFRMVTGEEDPTDELLSHLFWEMLEKEPDTGSINFDDADLSDEEYEKNQKAVEAYEKEHRFRYEKLEESARKKFNELTDSELMELAWRMEKRYRLPPNGDIQSVILPNGHTFYVHGCTADPVQVSLTELLDEVLREME